MKQSELKNLIKSSVREVFQEELKNIILESIKGNKNIISENTQIEKNQKNFPEYNTIQNEVTPPKFDRDFLKELVNSGKPLITESIENIPSDVINATLPEGEVDLNTILKMTKL
jgi:hypothetical protein